MIVQNNSLNNSPSFGINSLKLPTTGIGKRMEGLRPEIMKLGDNLTDVKITAYDPLCYIFDAKRPLVPFADSFNKDKTQNVLHHKAVLLKDIPDDAQGLFHVIKDFVIETQSKVIDAYQDMSCKVLSKSK